MEGLSKCGIDLTKRVDQSAGRSIFLKEINKKKSNEEKPSDKFALEVVLTALSSGMICYEEPIITDKKLEHVASYLNEILGGTVSSPRLKGCVKQLESMNIVINSYTTIYDVYHKLKGIIVRIGKTEIPIYDRDYAEKEKGLVFNDAHKDGFLYV